MDRPRGNTLPQSPLLEMRLQVDWTWLRKMRDRATASASGRTKMKLAPDNFPSTMDDPLSEEQLAVLAQGGCEASFEKLVRRVQVALVQFLLGRTGCRADAEDLAQESLVRAYRALGRYQPRWRFRTWLFTIAHRLSLNHRRDKHRDESILEPESIESPIANAPEIAVADEWRRSVWRLAAELLDADQTAGLWLHYVEELSTDEVGKILGRSRAAVKTMLFRARKKLMPGLRALNAEPAVPNA